MLVVLTSLLMCPEIEMGHRLHLLHISSIPFARDCYT